MATLRKTASKVIRKTPVVRPGPRRPPGTGAVVVTTPSAGTTPPVVPVTPTPTPTPTATPMSAPTTPTSRRQAEELVKDVLRLRADITTGFYRMGLALRELAKPEAYRALGHETFAELLDARDLVSRATAFKLLAIVDHLPQPLARRLGVEKSYGAIRYARLAHPDRDVVDVIRTDPRIPGSAGRLPLSHVSSRSLDAAIRALRTADASAAEGGGRARRAARSLAQRLERAGIDADRVRSMRRGNGWRIRIDLDVREAEELSALLRAGR